VRLPNSAATALATGVMLLNRPSSSEAARPIERGLSAAVEQNRVT
jgi:hypothetical protein